MALRMTRSAGMLVLGIWLLLTGINGLALLGGWLALVFEKRRG